MANDLDRKYVVSRNGKLEKLTKCVSRAEADIRIEREIVAGQFNEIDLYEYVGTYRPKKTYEVVNIFEEPEG
jgi:hypothetical protein